MFKVKFTSQGKRDLQRLPKDLQTRVVKKLKFFSSQENPVLFSKPLVDLPPATHRFRVGSYRIAFFFEDEWILIDKIRHRREVYRR